MISSAFIELSSYLNKNKFFDEIKAKNFSNRLIGRILFI